MTRGKKWKSKKYEQYYGKSYEPRGKRRTEKDE
jgi:hypothetical protein